MNRKSHKWAVLKVLPQAGIRRAACYLSCFQEYRLEERVRKIYEWRTEGGNEKIESD